MKIRAFVLQEKLPSRLAWLTSADQVVILCDSSDARLFYKGKVYFRAAEVGFKDLPKCQQVVYCPIWVLVTRTRGHSMYHLIQEISGQSKRLFQTPIYGGVAEAEWYHAVWDTSVVEYGGGYAFGLFNSPFLSSLTVPRLLQFASSPPVRHVLIQTGAVRPLPS